uniref:Uncharacterized protein n=1 Tax=Sphaerodactylus townsendi TaxID=933632 RepID=A0ACB8EGZ7_9SAUR
MTTASPELDFETVSLYKLLILVRDDKGNTASQTIFVLVSDVEEPPVFTGVLAQLGRVAEIYISEDTPKNIQIFTVTAKDPEGFPLK